MHDILTLLPFFIFLVFAAIIHECAHGLAAYKLGDPTAKRMGRLTLNPVPHIDLRMTVIVPIVILILSGGRMIFGGAKPVPINYTNLHYPRRDIPLISLAGPGSNFLMAIAVGLIMRLFTIPHLMEELLVLFIFVNVLLGTFNMIPIPPLDGSKILSFFLPDKAMYHFFRLERYGFIILIVLIFFTPLFRLLFYVIRWLTSMISGIPF